jgi:hypothetical protein
MATNQPGTSGAETLNYLEKSKNVNDFSPWRFDIAPMMDFAD